MKQVDLIRRYSLKKVNEIRLFISSLPEAEPEAMAALYGVPGQETATAIADFILDQLGHPAPADSRFSPTRRAARKIMPDGPAPDPVKPLPKYDGKGMVK